MTLHSMNTAPRKLFHETPFLTPETRWTASKLPNSERQWMVNNLLHRYEMFDAGWKLLADAHRPVNGGDVGKGSFGALYGDPRGGKTAICEAYMAKYAPSVDQDGEVYPMVYIAATAGMTPSTLTDEIYYQTGSRAQAAKVPQHIRNRNALDRLIMHRTELVIIDDAQYLLFDRRKDEVPKFNSFIKSLIEAKSFAVVLVGEPKIRKWVFSLPEMSGRNYFEEFVGQFDGSEDGRERFQLLMGGIDDLLPFAETSNLGEPDMADEMYAYSDGYLGRVMVVIRRACWTAINEGHRYIRPETLRDACMRSPWKENQRTFFNFGAA